MSASGELDELLLDEILGFELATNELRFLPRRRIGEGAKRAADDQLRLHPLGITEELRHPAIGRPRGWWDCLVCSEGGR
jgi:hypothetical protein